MHRAGVEPMTSAIQTLQASERRKWGGGAILINYIHLKNGKAMGEGVSAESTLETWPYYKPSFKYETDN
jgi:hypothetical protein